MRATSFISIAIFAIASVAVAHDNTAEHGIPGHVHSEMERDGSAYHEHAVARGVSINHDEYTPVEVIETPSAHLMARAAPSTTSSAAVSKPSETPKKTSNAGMAYPPVAIVAAFVAVVGGAFIV